MFCVCRCVLSLVLMKVEFMDFLKIGLLFLGVICGINLVLFVFGFRGLSGLIFI